jgi:ABC-2 type transport system ATP-binding protein
MIEGLKELGKTIFLTTHYMDEAQHLADRVAILRDGRLVAQGRTEELSGGRDQATVVRFGLPAGATPHELGSLLGAPVEVAGNEASVRTQHPQKTLYALTGWAEQRGIELTGLDVRRPSLEDIFLELTGDSQAQSGSGPSSDAPAGAGSGGGGV